LSNQPYHSLFIVINHLLLEIIMKNYKKNNLPVVG
jgi:hypothetical protein